jgi:hypothetical protein
VIADHLAALPALFPFIESLSPLFYLSRAPPPDFGGQYLASPRTSLLFLTFRRVYAIPAQKHALPR